jgi:pyruvate kinase
MRVDTNLKLLTYRRTKIVATLGPSSSDSGIIERLMHAGANVFRLNMSHGTYEDHEATYRRIRRVADHLNKPITVFADLCGPKIRVGTFRNGKIELNVKDSITVTCRGVEGGPGLIPSQYKALADDIEIGDRILLDDGNIELRVNCIKGTEIGCEVINGGVLSDNKGMNLPGVDISAPSLTEKDRVDARFVLELGVDFLALSFVRKGTDVKELRGLIEENGGQAAIIAKIEKPEALENIDEIIENADAVMIARGDLGVELPPQAVPTAQDQLIDLARASRKPVIVATQMLESMILHPRPTRAEVSDVANAVRSGADAIMLSGETAAGNYPVESVRMMDDIARQTEAYLWRLDAFRSLIRRMQTTRPLLLEDAISESMSQLSRDLLVRAIVVISMRGRSLSVMSSSRPAAPMIGICPDRRSRCIANLLWGVIPVIADQEEIVNPNSLARRIVSEFGLASEGQAILVVRGFSSDPKQNTPSVTVVTV